MLLNMQCIAAAVCLQQLTLILWRNYKRKPVFDRLIREKRFERYVLLGNEPQIGTIQEIYDERGSLLYQDQEEKTAIC